MNARTFLLTALAMIAFASNSLLCRAALRGTGIDAASFTFVRILSGALALWLIVTMQKSRSSVAAPPRRRRITGSWISAFALFAYAAGFSFAYNSLSAGTGALLLFGAVQATMIFWGIKQGERLRAAQVAGVTAAVAGLIVLVFPGLSAPPLVGSALMLAAGVAWGIYSLRGKATNNAIAATAANFVCAIPFAMVISLALIAQMRLNWSGISYAIVSGAITSGFGYVIWYTTLPELKAATAASVQLSVPVLTATGGILFLQEPITLRYVLASLAVLGGIFLVVIERQPKRPAELVDGAPR